MKKIVLFTGAGMSVPMGLPAANGFADTIKKCDPNLLNIFNEYLGNNAGDIEKILYTIDEFVNGSRFIKHIIQRNNSNSYFQAVYNDIGTNLNKASAFDQRVKSDIFNILQNFNRERSISIYINLLKSYKDIYKDFSLSIFTTNYDLIFENVYEGDELDNLGYKEVEFGFKHNKGKSIFDSTREFNWPIDVIEYNKLHGSLDWTKDNNGKVVKTGANTSPANPDNMPLLYPGFKGTPINEPFISLHNKLYVRLTECDEVHVVGFAFRDPYINSIFEFAMRAKSKPDFRIKCFNPCVPEHLPSESAIPDFMKRFSKIFKYHEKGIEDSTDPLGLLNKSVSLPRLV